MTKPLTEEDAVKVALYHTELRKHLKCENGPFFGKELWKHVKSCGIIPEPRIYKSSLEHNA